MKKITIQPQIKSDNKKNIFKEKKCLEIRGQFSCIKVKTVGAVI